MADRLYEVIEILRGRTDRCPPLTPDTLRVGKMDGGSVRIYAHDDDTPACPAFFELDRAAARMLRDQLNEVLGEGPFVAPKPYPQPPYPYPYTWKPLIWCQGHGTASPLPEQGHFTCETKSE
jgi:hypothetical protein